MPQETSALEENWLSAAARGPSLPSGTGPRSEGRVDFGGIVGKSKMCMSHSKNLVPVSGTELLLKMYKEDPTKVPSFPFGQGWG